VLAAALNGLMLLAISVFITFEAVQRLRHPSEVEAGGLNRSRGRRTGRKRRGGAAPRPLALDERGVRRRLHVLSDSAARSGALTAGILLALTGSSRIDPLLSLVIVALIVIAATRLLRDAGYVLMDRVPRGIDLREVERRCAPSPA